MAQQGKRLHRDVVARVRRLAELLSIRAVARELGLHRNTVRKYVRKAPKTG